MTLEAGRDRTPGHIVVETVWRDKIAAALKKHGYADVEANKLIEGEFVDVHFAWNAVEVDFAFKWHEAIGRALLTGLRTRSKPVVLLIADDITVDDVPYVNNARLVAKNNTPPIQVWVLDTRDGTLNMGDGRTIHVE